MSERSFENIPVNSIICPQQPREHFDATAQAGLEATVRSNGVQVPILLRRRDGKLYLWDGARRLRAAKAAGLTSIPSVIEDGEVGAADVTLTQVLLNCQREDLTPLEKAKAIDGAMKETGASATQIAAKLGLSDATVTRLLALLKLPESIQQHVANGKIPLSTAYEISRIPDAAKQLELAAQAAGGQLTRDAISGTCKSSKKRKREPQSAQGPSRMTVQLGGGKSVTVTVGGLTLESFIETLEQVISRARQARTKGFSLDTFRKILNDTAGV
jgi:ParB family chromosome partitioning protein